MVADGPSFQCVDRRAVAAWRWTGAIASAFVFFACAALAVRLPLIAAVPLLVLLAILLAVLAWWYPAAKYRHLAYRIDETGIVIRMGITWRVQVALARTRIQHADITQGPLQRHHGVATLKLYTAGSHYTKTELPGLSHETAIVLRDDLQQEGASDDDGA